MFEIKCLKCGNVIKLSIKDDMLVTEFGDNRLAVDIYNNLAELHCYKCHNNLSIDER